MVIEMGNSAGGHTMKNSANMSTSGAISKGYWRVFMTQWLITREIDEEINWWQLGFQ